MPCAAPLLGLPVFSAAAYRPYNAEKQVFDHSSNVQLINSNIAVNQHIHPNSELRFLYEATAKYAGSGHQDPSTCLEGTRTTSLQEIDEWKRKSRQEPGSELLWLTGSAGSGKTAIAQTVCERFRKEGLFVVDCSFFRSTNRTDPRYLFLTIAYQLAVANELLKAYIEAILHADPGVVDANLDMLLKRLILDPITKAGGQLPTIFVILDGLDECGVEDQQIQIIRLIQVIVTNQDLRIRFLIASRPESWIHSTLSSPSVPSHSTVILNQDEEADNDIRFFYETEFKKVRDDPRHADAMTSTLSPWPSDSELVQLVRWASAQFIYAKTVTRFVGEPGHSPMRRLEVVLQPDSDSTNPGSPLDRLDALYTHILSSVADWSTTRIFLGALLAYNSEGVQREKLSVSEIIHGLNPGDAYLALRNLHPLVFVPPDLTPERETFTNEEYRAILDDDSQYPRIYHKSFIDFLYSPERAGKHFIEYGKIHQDMAIGCLKVLQSVTSRPLTRLFCMTWSYSDAWWCLHCLDSAYQGNRELLKELNHFSFLSWYFISWKLNDKERWKKLAPVRQLETWNDDALEAIQKIQKTLKALNIDEFYAYYPSDIWNWMNKQRDISFLGFPMLRLKLWILHKLNAYISRREEQMTRLAFKFDLASTASTEYYTASGST